MNYITTNIRIPEDDYLKLKAEAAKKRKSLAAIIREKIIEPEDKTEPVTKSLLAITDLAEKENWSGPSDLATDHDKYFIEAFQEINQSK